MKFMTYNEEGGYAESVARMMLESVNHMKANNQPIVALVEI